MKKLIMITLSLMVFGSSAQADMTDSEWFEPGLFCVGLGTAGYFSAPKGNEAVYSAGACAVGALVGYTINSYYKGKYTHNSAKRIDELEKAVAEFQRIQAENAAEGKPGPYSMKILEVVPGQRLSNGDVLAPTLREKLLVPGQNLRVGE